MDTQKKEVIVLDFSLAFFSALLAIILIDLVLAGDNAVVIGMAARNLPKEKQNKVIFWGTAGAIIIRFICTIAIVWLLKIPGLLLVGGILLLWVAYKLLIEEKQHEAISADVTVAKAISTIIIADTVMGVDNMIAVAGVAHGDMVLIVLGLLISIPIMVFGSRLVITLTEKYPIVIYIGSAVLAFTAGKMMLDEKFLEDFVKPLSYWKWFIIVGLTVAVLLAGWLKKRSKGKQVKISH
jgi:YjbE family integral membrane protein